jgi:hypothetical protein
MSRTSRTRDNDAHSGRDLEGHDWLAESPNGNLVRGTACRKTDEFWVPATAALIGGLTALPEKG